MGLAGHGGVKAEAIRAVLWTGSVGILAVLLRRFLRRRPADVSVGNVSEDWLAQQRGTGDPASW